MIMEKPTKKARMLHIKCAKCGAEFDVPARGNGKTKYCKDCAAKARREAKAEWLKRKPEKPKASPVVVLKCERCGKDIVILKQYSRRRKFCDDCTAINNRERSARNIRIWLEKEAQKPKPKKAKSTIEATLKAARAAGMSYGKYKAMMQMKGAV